MAQNNLSPIQAASLVYPHRASIADEVYSPSGQMKGHWEYLLQSLEALGPVALGERQEKARRILRDDGATYNIYDDTEAPSRTWGLDLVPALIGSEEWGRIEAGLLERAELFNLLLKDIYGPRNLIRYGVFPPEVLYSHAGFLRACVGIKTPGDHDLIIHAVDLIRSAGGDMCVLTDRTQAPSGAGYALENRTVMSRVLPSLFRDSHVHRLALFFQRLRGKLMSLSVNPDQPQVVVLTPGAHNETYFEHAYLANYLGFPLVQSGDLVVRNGYVWMRSLNGLSRVDVILRRVDDWFCDPVELRGDSQLGVAGLLSAVRAGRVVIANPLGSGILESPVFLKYLPKIGKTLLGREPRLRSVQTFWCGDPKDLDHVINHIPELVIKPVFRSRHMQSVLGHQLNAAQRQELIARIKASPYQYVAQPSVMASHVPAFDGHNLVPRPSLLRSFAVASDTDYVLMPGGLTRIGQAENSFLITNQAGSVSKDTWVLASEPERISSVAAGVDGARFQAGAATLSLPSRVVENLFWMGRYAERAEASLRLLRTVFMLLNNEEPVSQLSRRYLLQAVTQVTSTFPGFADADDKRISDPDEELLLVIKDGSRTGSIRSNLNAMLLSADESKELLSSDTLRVINDIRDVLDNLDTTLGGDLASAPEEALDPLVTALMALSGLTHESMIRGIGWKFMQIGRRLERGMQTIAIIRTLLVPALNEADQVSLLQALLLSLEVLISYRRRYRANMNVEMGLELVMLDNSNPRSLIYQFEQLRGHIDSLPHGNGNGAEAIALDAEQRALLEANTAIKLSRLQDLCAATESATAGKDKAETENKRATLEALLVRLNGILAETSVIISDKYFDHRVGPTQLVRNMWELE